jgi:regulatory protein
MRARLSLKARAIAWLAQREQSRVELRRKLLRRARADAAADATAARALRSGDADASAEPGGAPAAIEASVEELLDWLEAHDYLSPARFADARLHARAARHGTERIRHELARHGVTLDAAALQALRASELQRAQALWQRRFGGAAADASARARQARFLAGRGFSAEVIRRVVKGCVEG